MNSETLNYDEGLHFSAFHLLQQVFCSTGGGGGGGGEEGLGVEWGCAFSHRKYRNHKTVFNQGRLKAKICPRAMYLKGNNESYQRVR